MFKADMLKNYRLLDCGDGMKLEDWNGVILSRPDPQVVWKRQFPELWGKADAVYIRSREGGGNWKYKKKLPERWTIEELGLKFYVRPTGFKHTGLFPEQAYNWKVLQDTLSEGDNVLNLFAYTGAASMAAASTGAKVVHVDAAKGMVAWAKENQEISGLNDKTVRYIVDDCLKFVLREQRRGNKYEAIIMDPPSYGRGTNGEVWKIEDKIDELVEECSKILSDRAKLFIINSYTTGLSSVVTQNILNIHVNSKIKGKIEADNLVIPVENSDMYLPCGTTARWYRE